MPRLANGQLSHVPGKGFRVSVGYYLKGGKPTPKVFWLGHDPVVAHYYADQARGNWFAITLTGGTVWTDDELTGLKDAVAFFTRTRAAVFAKHERRKRDLALEAEMVTQRFGVPAQRQQMPPASEVAEPPAAAKLYAALEAYKTAMQAKTFSPSYKRRIEECVDTLKRYRPDVDLSSVDRVWLETLTDEIKARPLSRTKDRRTKKRERIQPGTVKTLLQHWRQAFDWIDRASDSDRFGRWEAPKRMNDLFACDLNALRTKVERDKAADGPEQLTVPEIKKLIHKGNDRQRMLMLMGLFAGMGQTELRWCRRDEFDLAAATFTHRRNKTGQKGSWHLPPELVKLLREYFKDVKPLADGSAFSTREGQPLVTETSDSVRQWFEDVRKETGLERPGVTFYALRRFLGDRAKRKGGIELRDAALAHAGHSVGDKHYSNFRDFEKVQELGRELHAELTKAGVFKWPKESEGEKNMQASAAA